MNKKIICTILATAILCGTLPVQSIERSSRQIRTESSINKNKRLPDGTYTIAASAKKEDDHEADSSANSYLNKTSNLYVENGEMTLELRFENAKPIKKIGVQVNGAEAENCIIDGVGTKDITIKFKIDSLDDEIILPMEINPFASFVVKSSAFIKLDKNELRNEAGDIVDLDSLPEDGSASEGVLKDGNYTIITSAKNEKKPEEDSTANSYLNKTSNLYVKNGELILELKFENAKPIKEIGVKVNGAEPDNCEINGVGSGDITLKFKIDSLDDEIILPMKISPMSFVNVEASAIIKLDKSQLKDEEGNLVYPEDVPGEDDGKDDISDDKDDKDDDSGNNDDSDNGSESGKDLSDILEQGVTYTVKNIALDESTNTEQFARGFVDAESKLEVKDGTTYVTVKFLERNQMANQKVVINNVETAYEEINEAENKPNNNLEIRFPIKSLTDKIKISMDVSAINKNVAFNLQFDRTTVKDPDGNIIDVGAGSNSDVIEDAPEIDLNVNKKYKGSNIIRGLNGEKEPDITSYIEEHSIVEVVDKNLYAYITFANSSLMIGRELTVNGVKQVFKSTVNSNGSYTIKVKLNSINDDIEFTNLLTKNINDGFKIRVNGNTLTEYKESSNSGSSDTITIEDDLDDGKYTIKNKVLKEDSNSESMARDYVDTESEIEVKKDKIYLTLKFTKGSLMSNVSIKVNDKKTSYETVKKSGDKYYIKFKIGSLSDEILVSSTIMNSMDVKFRVLLRSSTLDEIDDDDDTDKDDETSNDNNGSDNINNGSGNINGGSNSTEGNGTGGTQNGSGNNTESSGSNNTTQSYTRTTYSIKNKVISNSAIGYQAARDAINELSYLEHENDKIYLTLNLEKTDLMSNIRVNVAGKEVSYNTFNKNDSANTMSIKFEVPNENPDITITAYIGMISRDISFGLGLLQDTKTFVKSEEINASQLENITSGSGSSNSSGSSNGSSSGSAGSSSSFGGGSSSEEPSNVDIAEVEDQLSKNTIEASEYFKRYTINNEVISDSAMGRTMARKYLNETSILEEIDGKFYITVTFSGTGAMDNFRFVVNGADVEYEVIFDDSENGIKSFRFPISSVNDSIQAYMFIKPVKMNIDFGIKLLEDTMVLVEEGTVGDDGTLEQDSSLLGDIVDKATKKGSTGEVSPIKIAVSTSTLTIILNQLVSLLTSYIKKRKAIKIKK